MRAWLSVVLLGALAVTSVQSSSQAGEAADFKRLASLVGDDTVAEMRVLHLHDSTMTRVAVSPGALRSLASSDVTLREHISETFASLFSDTTVKRENRKPDLRWGVLFYDSQNHEIASVLVDKFARAGYVNGHSVSFSRGGYTDIASRLHKITGIAD